MPQSLIIAMPDSFPPDTVFRVPSEPPWNLAQSRMDNSPFQLQLWEKDLSWHIDIIQMHNPQEIALDYMENADIDASFRDKAPYMNFFSLSFNDYEVAREFLVTIFAKNKNLKDCWIDNDYGLVLSGETFFGNLLSNPDWDWRFGPS